MSERKKIFISYRRDDVPGYVARIEDDLESTFGQHTVFRDVEDIAGGTEWKNAIEYNLQASAALILVIGPHWSRLWEERQNDPVNYIAWELQRARELGLTIIPVTIHGGTLPPELDLGDVAWLRDKQFYDISDRQNRWKYDMQGLIGLLDRLPDLTIQTNKPVEKEKTEKKSKSWIWIAAASVLVLLGISALIPEIPDEPDEDPVQPVKSDQFPGKGLLVATAEDETPTQAGTAISDKTVVASEPTNTGVVATRPKLTRPKTNAVTAPQYTYEIPDISGTWVSSLDGTVYHVIQQTNGNFTISSPGYATGKGQFIKNMPRKFKVTMDGVGHGEYSVSNSDETAMGWFVDNETGEKVYEKMTRVQ